MLSQLTETPATDEHRDSNGWISPPDSVRVVRRPSDARHQSPMGNGSEFGSEKSSSFPMRGDHTPRATPTGLPTSSPSHLLTDLTARLQHLAATSPSPRTGIHTPPIRQNVLQPLARRKVPSDRADRYPPPPPPRPAHRRRSPSPIDRNRPLGTDSRRGRSRAPKVLWRSEVPEDGDVQDRLKEVRTMDWVRGRGRDQRSREGWSRGLDEVVL